MILKAVRLSLVNLLTPEARGAFWKILGVTLAVLAVLWLILRALVVDYLFPWAQAYLPAMPEWTSWLGLIAAIGMGIGLALVLAFLMSPIAALVAGLFLDDVAEVIEKRDYPDEPQGQALPFGLAIRGAIQFLGIVILANACALLMLFIPGVNLIAFFVVNSYLLGREFFEFAAMRYRSPKEAKQFRAKHAARIFLAGLAIAAFLAVPIVNLLTPLFAAALMVHLHKALSRVDPTFGALERTAARRIA